MIRINLLPHRELKKAAHRKRFQNMLAAALLAGLGLSYAGYSWLDSTLGEQQRRNQQLEQAIAQLDQQLSNIENLRQQRMALLSRKELVEQLQSSRTEATAIANYVAPKGPGRAWSVDEATALAAKGLTKRNFANGEAMYRSTMCATCHRFNGEGGSIGPDLTGSGNRYTLRDLMENIVDPSKVISDQYDSHQITKKDGSTILGRIVVEENGKVFVMANPFAPNDQMAINEGDIAKKETRKVSMMPPGLINALNQDEQLDLIAYLISGGNPQDKVFAK